MNKYKELRDRQQAEVNALPLGFAFGKSQFDEMMSGWGLDPEKRAPEKRRKADALCVQYGRSVC